MYYFTILPPVRLLCTHTHVYNVLSDLDILAARLAI